MEIVLLGLTVSLLAIPFMGGMEGNTSNADITTFNGVVEEVHGSLTTIKLDEEQNQILSSDDKVNVDLSELDASFIIEDDTIFEYTGDIMESYPLKSHEVEMNEFEKIINDGTENTVANLLLKI
ncbi:hypothetical protein AN640_07815 [Candidatus Epulonipiscium fishelsonii]|uniref:Uncharacterized protein n=1 Tax=Candidatus Epulonipiscium fishelsonii TaxID=77094 RepID=A0ACC8XFB8_9FIRM|nr:hypothetical protein AN640_07815 [Epulopiscium sp. SCG-D08WGA-EpuloA1]OON95190.1 MAG: hypothetical protein ATN32_07230 [Epulopiscium sp. AS2M-Bin002]